MNIFKGLSLLIIVATIALFSVSCSNNKEVAAYNRAKLLYTTGNYNGALMYIDSIKILNPKNFDYIRAGMQLERQAKVAINRRIIKNIADSLPLYVAEHDKLLERFNYTKNNEYQNRGTLVYKGLKDSDLQNKSQIRVDVTEDGELRVLSVYFGTKPLKHTSIKLSSTDGSYAMSNRIPYDGASNYRYKVDGNNIETITYREPYIRSLAEFTTKYYSDKITVSYEGDFPFSYTLDKGTKDAIRDSYKMSMLIKKINELNREDCIAARGVMVLEKQINEHRKDSI